MLYPVVYDEKRVLIHPYHLEQSNWPIISLLFKAPAWAYEQEWRYINAVDPIKQQDRSKPLILAVPNAIKAIYLGVDAVKYNADSVEKLKVITKSLNLPLFEMRFDDYGYKLIPQLIDN